MTAGTETPEDRRCACVSRDARECIRIRYRCFDADGEDDGIDETCECVCHDEQDDDDART